MHSWSFNFLPEIAGEKQEVHPLLFFNMHLQRFSDPSGELRRFKQRVSDMRFIKFHRNQKHVSFSEYKVTSLFLSRGALFGQKITCFYRFYRIIPAKLCCQRSSFLENHHDIFFIIFPGCFFSWIKNLTFSKFDAILLVNFHCKLFPKERGGFSPNGALFPGKTNNPVFSGC